MCIRDRYQRRVHGEQKKAVKTKKEQAHHSKTMNSSIISSQEMNSLGYNAIKKFNECVAASGKTPTQIFQEADVNRDGRIKEMEFYKLIDSFDPKKSIFSLLEIVSLTKIADKDRSGSIDYNEFLGLCGQVTSGASTVVFPGSYTEKTVQTGIAIPNVTVLPTSEKALPNNKIQWIYLCFCVLQTLPPLTSLLNSSLSTT
eukprot:TRINITY_DN94_c0_g1_i5.p2 TRINITY_DN94_c0_g1~~TRINITY_DN94_c0_g1_i5.p2  ORF type:complete len:225 (+),score=85.89 TRINITY_DN94_c0_g1_i5:77-676(+)